MGRINSWAKGCLSKNRYTSVDKCREVAAKVLKERKTVLHCYYCRDCGGYHLTKAAKKPWHIF